MIAGLGCKKIQIKHIQVFLKNYNKISNLSTSFGTKLCRVCDKGRDSSHVESPELHQASGNQLQPKRLSFHLYRCRLLNCSLLETDWERKPDKDSVFTCTSVLFRQMFFNKSVSALKRPTFRSKITI